MNGNWNIRGGRVVDPVSRRDEVRDLFVRRGLIVESPGPGGTPARDIAADGRVVVPGFIDLHVHFREPGNEAAETVASGALAAARGGFTAVVTMPNTTPATDTPEWIAYTLAAARHQGRVRVLPSACITRGRQGRELADLAALKAAGAVAFTDDGATVADPDLMAAAMHAAAGLDIPVMDHALDPGLAGSGVMHEGPASARLGLPGIPSRAETTVVERNIALAEASGAAVHVQHVSTREAVALIRDARARGIRVSGEATPHHLALTDADVDPGNPNFKMNPPLRTEADRRALLAGVADGALQAFATDHAPHTAAAKAAGFREAPFGILGLETAIPVTYTLAVAGGGMDLITWVQRWTAGPAAVLGIPPPRLVPGRPADLAILDLDSEWTVRADDFLSKSRNTPFDGRRFVGRAMLTLVDGAVTWQAPDAPWTGD